MTPMHRFVTAALLIGASLVAACGDAKLDSEAASELQGARADATEALDRVDSLEDRLVELELALTAAERDRKDLDDATDRLDKALAELKKSLRAAGSSADAAAGDAAAALAKADQVARDLAVLEDRYEYHLRRYHGGG